jgi:hypothetical protein
VVKLETGGDEKGQNELHEGFAIAQQLEDGSGLNPACPLDARAWDGQVQSAIDRLVVLIDSSSLL